MAFTIRIRSVRPAWDSEGEWTAERWIRKHAPAPIWQFFSPFNLDDVTHLAIARDDGVMVGMFACVALFDDQVSACGTYVVPDYRRRGIATRLWRAILNRLDPERMHVTTITDAGFAFVRKMRRPQGIPLHTKIVEM